MRDLYFEYEIHELLRTRQEYREDRNVKIINRYYQNDFETYEDWSEEKIEKHKRKYQVQFVENDTIKDKIISEFDLDRYYERIDTGESLRTLAT